MAIWTAARKETYLVPNDTVWVLPSSSSSSIQELHVNLSDLTSSSHPKGWKRMIKFIVNAFHWVYDCIPPLLSSPSSQHWSRCPSWHPFLFHQLFRHFLRVLFPSTFRYQQTSAPWCIRSALHFSSLNLRYHLKKLQRCGCRIKLPASHRSICTFLTRKQLSGDQMRESEHLLSWDCQ